MAKKTKNLFTPWIKVENSSNVKKFRYQESTQRLEVEFLRGGVYAYSPVTPAEFEDLKAAESKGKWMNENIKSGHRVKYEKLEPK